MIPDPQPQPQEREMDWEPQYHTHTDACYPQGVWMPEAKEVCGYIGPRHTGRTLKCIPVIRLQYLESQERQVAALSAEIAQLREELAHAKDRRNAEPSDEFLMACLVGDRHELQRQLSTLQQSLRALAEKWKGSGHWALVACGDDLARLLASSRQEQG